MPVAAKAEAARWDSVHFRTMAGNTRHSMCHVHASRIALRGSRNPRRIHCRITMLDKVGPGHALDIDAYLPPLAHTATFRTSRIRLSSCRQAGFSSQPMLQRCHVCAPRCTPRGALRAFARQEGLPRATGTICIERRLPQPQHVSHNLIYRPHSTACQRRSAPAPVRYRTVRLHPANNRWRMSSKHVQCLKARLRPNFTYQRRLVCNGVMLGS